MATHVPDLPDVDAPRVARDPTDGSSAPSTGAPTHWAALDGLRGIAVAGVVAYHLGWISGGFLGVDLFFTLSGFLITTLVLREHAEHGRLDLTGFWSRRFRRLLPAVMLLVAAVLAWTWWWGTPAEQAGARSEARWAIPYLANWHLIAESRDYWAAATDSSVFTHLWSLAIEEQFYVVWPLVAWWALRGSDRRRGVRRLGLVAAPAAIASAAAMVAWYDPASPSRVYLGTDTRAFALLLGALAAITGAATTLTRCAAARTRRLDAVAACLAFALAVSWVIGGDHLGVLLQGGLVVHSALATALVVVLAASSDLGGGGARVLGRRWLTWLGQRSYGVYLWHWPVIVLATPRWTALPAPLRDAAMVAVSLLLAELSYRLVEQPIRRRTGWAAGRRADRATVGLSAVAVVLALVAPSGRGHVASFDPTGLGPVAADTTALATTAAAPPATVPATVPGTDGATETSTAPSTVPAAPSTTLAPPPDIGRLRWLGDSVAADLAPALVAAFAAAGVEVIDDTGDGLRFTPGGGVDPLEVWGELLATAPYDTVVVQLSYWDSPATVDELRVGLGWVRDQVLVRGARLVFVLPPPVRDDLVDPGILRQVQVVQELRDQSGGSVLYVDTVPLWGPTMQVDLDGDGVPDRKPDGVHVCPQGAARFAAWLVDDLAGRFGDVVPQPVGSWAGGDWTASIRYDTPPGACIALS